MSEIRFYHLIRLTLDQALPDLLRKCVQRGWRALVLVSQEDQVEPLTKQLWAGRPDSFLPHGSTKDGRPQDQPIWITAEEGRPNDPQVLFCCEGATVKSFDGYDLVCEVFDGKDYSQVEAARTRWKSYKDSGHDLTYWQQTENGWEKKG